MYLILQDGLSRDLASVYEQRPPLDPSKKRGPQHVYLFCPDSSFADAALTAELTRAWDALGEADLATKGVGWALCPIDVLYGTCKKANCTGLHLRQTIFGLPSGVPQILAKEVLGSMAAIGIDRQKAAWEALALTLPDMRAIMSMGPDGVTYIAYLPVYEDRVSVFSAQ